MKTKNNVVMIDRQLEYKENRLSIGNRNREDTNVGNVNVTVHCSDYLYMGIQSAILFEFDKEAEGCIQN